MKKKLSFIFFYIRVLTVIIFTEQCMGNNPRKMSIIQGTMPKAERFYNDSKRPKGLGHLWLKWSLICRNLQNRKPCIIPNYIKFLQLLNIPRTTYPISSFIPSLVKMGWEMTELLSKMYHFRLQSVNCKSVDDVIEDCSSVTPHHHSYKVWWR